jgi:hypothetical protein
MARTKAWKLYLLLNLSDYSLGFLFDLRDRHGDLQGVLDTFN